MKFILTEDWCSRAIKPRFGVTRALLSIAIATLLTSPGIRLRAQVQEAGWPPSIKVEVVAGQAAKNLRTRKAVEPLALVTDETGQPVSGVMVIFTLPETGPDGAFAGGSERANVYINSEGKATARGLTPNATPGQFQILVNASLHGFAASTTADQTNVLPDGGNGSSKLAMPIAGGAPVAGADGRGGSSPNPTAPPRRTATTITPGTPVFGAPQQ